MSDRRERLLRAAFLAGAVTDALALGPLLFPPLARLLWGFDDPSGAHYPALRRRAPGRA